MTPVDSADTLRADIERLASGDIQMPLLDLHLAGASGLERSGK